MLSNVICRAIIVHQWPTDDVLNVKTKNYLPKHIRHCTTCSSGKTCYRTLQERSVGIEKFAYTTYLCYLLYAPLYIAGPIISFNAFASQLDTPQKNYTLKQVAWYGIRWVLSLILMEIMTHFFYYNAFAISGIWKQLSPMEVFIVGYGVRADVT
nr:putative membrane-bound O-acyltransferase C24H6.01c [Tanacetum cinerariifolium]